MSRLTRFGHKVLAEISLRKGNFSEAEIHLAAVATEIIRDKAEQIMEKKLGEQKEVRHEVDISAITCGPSHFRTVETLLTEALRPTVKECASKGIQMSVSGEDSWRAGEYAQPTKAVVTFAHQYKPA
ncbi:MAG: hypothetical protein ABL931_17535 [Usitatibacteraceae bacterium]